MGAENDDQSSPGDVIDVAQDTPKKAKIRYTREFLISLGELKICKKLPDGFDPAILSDFGDDSNSVQERPRNLGTLSAHNFRRGEYGSSPPTRGDSANYSRGRWDTRSSGSNDRDSNSQLDGESEKRYGNRRSWQSPEQHDGLLGSGAFPRPSGSTAGTSGTKVRANGPYQLNRSSEPYHPPRPYKAVPHSRREMTDSINDETFGGSEISSEDRAEEERKRRASFEQFRKEQKAFHEKQKQFPDEQKESTDPDMTALLRNKPNGSEDVTTTISQDDSAKCSFPTQAPAPRPLVPPGFTSTVLEKSCGTKSSTHPAFEAGAAGLDGNNFHVEGDPAVNGISNRQADKKLDSRAESSETQYEIKTNPIPFSDVNEKLILRSSEEITNFDSQKVRGHDVIGTAGPEHSTSILDKLFGKASTVKSGSPIFIEDGDVKVEAGSRTSFQSSKFNHWFLEEEKKPTDDLSSGKPVDLLSLIVGGEKGGSQTSRVSDKNTSRIPIKGNENLDKFITPITVSTTGVTGEPPYRTPDASMGVLTCEDLEQSMLSEISENDSNVQHFEQPWRSSDAKVEHAKVEVDNHATLHILSLLKKESYSKDIAPSPDLGASENCHVYEAGVVSSLPDNSSKVNAGKGNNPGGNLTLETLFGSSFMNELHSAQAPVSAQRSSVGGPTGSDVDAQNFSFPSADDGFFPPTSENMIEKGLHTLHRAPQTKSNKMEENWLGYDASQGKLEPDLITIGGATKYRANEQFEIQLPEEESLLAPSRNAMALPVGHATKDELLSSSSMPVDIDIVDKLAALNAVIKRERSMLPGLDGPPFRRGPYDSLEPDNPFQNLHDRPSPQFTHQQMNHGRPMFPPVDSHNSQMHPQMKFMGPDHPEVAPHHHFPPNMFHTPSFQAGPGRAARFESPQHPMLQQMHMQGNLLPSHVPQGLPGGPPMPPYPINHMGGYVPEMNPMQGFPFGHRQPNYGGHEIPMQGPGGPGGNHPEALEKLIEMELRANLKQMPPPVSGGAHGLGNNSHGIDMGFRYR